MSVDFVTSFDDYNNRRISKRMMGVIKYRVQTTLCEEKLKGIFLLNKRNELFDNQTYWLLS